MIENASLIINTFIITSVKMNFDDILVNDMFTNILS